MTRKKIPTQGPYRYIRKSDITKTFTNELFNINRVTLKTLFYDNNGKTHVLVYDFDNNVLAFIAFHDMGTHFYLNLVETNRIPAYQHIKAGTKLIDYLDDVSQYFDYKKITLFSLPDLIPFYESLSYQQTGNTEYDSRYNMNLTEMKKIL